MLITSTLNEAKWLNKAKKTIFPQQKLNPQSLNSNYPMDKWIYHHIYHHTKIGHIHTHPVVAYVTLSNIEPISLNGHFTSVTCFAKNLISLA